MSRPRLVGLSLLLLTLLVYLPVCWHGFVAFDDPEYIVENRPVKAGLTTAGLKWAFTTFHASNWHPLTWLSHMLDSQLFGPDAGAHHFMSVVLHAANAVLLFFVLHRVTGALWPAACVAALFAWHPLHVESVAWASERKDVLSTLFWLLTIWAYANHAMGATRDKPGDARIGMPRVASYLRSRWYWVAVCFFLLGLMAKPMLVTLPFVLLLLDYWPLNRVGNACSRTSNWLALAGEKWPFVLLMVASCVVTILAQRTQAMVPLHEYPLTHRVCGAITAYGGYLLKTVWPSGLAAIYPARLTINWSHVAMSAAALIGISLVVFRMARRQPFLLVGWLWFLGTLVPVLGLVQVGSQAMADRYTYVPLIGIFIMAAFGGSTLAVRWHVPTAITAGISALAVGGCLVATRIQLTYWQDSESLFRRAVRVTTANARAHAGLADALARQGRNEEAIVHFQEALRLSPSLMNAHNDFANLLAALDRNDEALDHYQTALRLNPHHPLLHWNLGILLVKLGRFEEAISHYARAEQLDPGNPRSQCLMGKARALEGRAPEALNHFREALRLDPNHVETLAATARLLVRVEDARVRNNTEAIVLAERAVSLPGGYQVPVLEILAQAYANVGRLQDARAAVQEAIRLAEQAGHSDIRSNLQSQLSLYESKLTNPAVRTNPAAASGPRN